MFDALAAFVAGLTQLLAWPASGFLLAGVGIGSVVGLLPGLGGPAALALTLPFVPGLGPVEVVALVGGMAAVTVMAGDLTSILLGVPGEATSTAIMADGHAMARRGEGALAAGAATAASLLGALVGAVALALMVPLAQPLVSAMESPELFMLALLGVCLVVPLSGGALLKGLMAGAAGLLLATVGLDPSRGAPRFTFGQLFLWDGLGLLPVALGLYAVPEALALLRSRAGPVADEHTGGGTVREGLRATWLHLGLTARCSLLGVGVGVLPGVGASVSQWLAYAHAAQGSRRRARFGQGEIEGVIAPGAASAATLGGALVPTLALGIPGSVSSAFILGALMLVGLTPGPSFLRPESAGGHLTLVFSFVWAIILANALTTVVSLRLLGSLAKIARIRSTVLFPFVLTFILLGAVAEKRSAGDLVVVAVMGTVGLAMSRLDWPKAPLLLGLVLGPLIERRLLISIGAHGGGWMLRPAVIALAALVVAVLVRSAHGALVGRPAARARTRVELTADRAAAGLLGLLAVAGLWVGRDLPWAAGLLPRALLAAMAVMALAQVRASIRASRAEGPEVVTDRSLDPGRRPVGASSSLGWLALFVASMWLLGVAVGSGLSCAVFLRLAGRESWRGVALVTCALTALVYLLADQALGLPGGLISDMLSRFVTAGTLAAPVSQLPFSRLAGPWT